MLNTKLFPFCTFWTNTGSLNITWVKFERLYVEWRANFVKMHDICVHFLNTSVYSPLKILLLCKFWVGMRTHCTPGSSPSKCKGCGIRTSFKQVEHILQDSTERTCNQVCAGVSIPFVGVACRQGTLNPPDTWSRPFGTCICSTCLDQSFTELVVILPDYALRISLGTFLILLLTMPHRRKWSTGTSCTCL